MNADSAAADRLEVRQRGLAELGQQLVREPRLALQGVEELEHLLWVRLVQRLERLDGCWLR